MIDSFLGALGFTIFRIVMVDSFLRAWWLNFSAVIVDSFWDGIASWYVGA